ncbi:unnamed protein product [Caenorhabditis nigoni]|uniref:Uncharacterized protein n=1 Tax=Caenorhabditis nigoni TaxID=1611254 RepID=A0A2G5S9P9_9PELO|nr:hypothetical protein B9Z55_028843 [Caenorhabditis nigoni]PIC11789.1 hypothetical protein B9Z55_028847 [Caenorhabditis nigoni]
MDKEKKLNHSSRRFGSFHLLSNALVFEKLNFYNEKILDVGTIFTVLFVSISNASIASSSDQICNDVLKARVAARQIYRVIERISRIGALSTELQQIPNVSGRVEFKNVHFRYSTKKFWMDST